ncbi:Dual specificity protein kinase YAK1 [Grifola frondosa]|uniref:Dual specificity protein kinase YAK1 n=1 Tax=Grifola frondosa TaxID=5627 RepID=A0A1C7LQX7_GRIFR|nr:Dual specificity protein kinase YAK1 [Grifola frondosa]
MTDFDLPRWHNQALHDGGLSSSAQAAQSAAQASYMYSQAPPLPPPPAGTQSSRIHQPPSGSSRQPRINQLLDEDQQFGTGSLPPYSPNGGLGRSLSLGGATGTSSSRGRRHHMQDDLEGAFNVDGDTNQRHTPQSLYPPSIAYQTSSAGSANTTGSASNAADPYQDAYFAGTGVHTPKRSHTQHDAGSSRALRSPHRAPNQAAPIVDPYSPQHYTSPSSNSYPYSPSAEHRSFPAATYQSHSRSQSQVKGEPMSPPIPPPAYSPHAGAQPSLYSPGYPMDTTSPAPSSSQNLTAQRPARQTSISQPATPLSFGHNAQNSQGSAQYAPPPPDYLPMAVEVPPKRRATGLRRVRDHRDLRPFVNQHPQGRRMDAHGAYLSPLRQLTTNLVETYHICNPQFRYESTHNPRRVLTKPSKPAHNDSYDNEDYDYILYVNDWLGTDEGHKYLILDILGQGTFGQVVKCQNMKTHEVVAVKVVKNKPAYFNQSMMEVTILELLNNQCDPHDEHHILRLRDSFIHKNHLCLVFELLSSNLYELIKQNQFQGLSTQLVKVFTAQLLDAMTVLKEARLIHCDLKPENILLKSLQSPQIKVIDFGSACHERQTVYTYIQSRFYRSPEVLLGIPYTAAIDMWSLGCIAVELFLGLPLFPGTSEYNQITRIVEMLGLPPQYMLDMGKQTNQFFDSYVDAYNHKKYRLKSIEQYSREHNTQEQPGKQYFKANSLPDIIRQAPMPTFKSPSRQSHEADKEMNNRASFIDFCQGLLNMNPIERWSPQQARMHPFITGEKWTKPWTPAGQPNSQVSPPPTNPGPDPKRPYGGLVPSQPQGKRAYQDAAAYNQHLTQHQVFTAQQQLASQAAQNVYRNPYLTQQNPQQGNSAFPASQDGSVTNYAPQQQYNASGSQSQPTSHRGLTHQSSHGHLNVNTNVAQYAGQPTAGGFPVPAHLTPAVPSHSYYGNARTRSNTINNMMDNIPPALARLQHMNQDVIGGRKALTPVLKRDDAIREWERRQSGKAAAAQPYPQLEYLQQQAELAAAQGMNNWGHASTSNRYPPPSSSLAHSYQPNAMIVDEDRRDAIMSNVRSAAHADSGNMFAASSSIIPSPPQAYASKRDDHGKPIRRHVPAAATAVGSIALRFGRPTDRYWRSYGPYSNAAAQHGAASRQVAPPAQAVPPSFYGAGVVPAGHVLPVNQRNPFSAADALPTPQGQASTKESRRKSGIDLWTQ